jgi:uncharacterized membrane-anchored protein
VAAVTLQVLLLGFMAGEREWTVRAGRQILLRTAPIDPNDPMRGDYARLSYDLSSVPSSLWRDGLVAKLAPSPYDYRQKRDVRVYASLRIDDSGIAELVSLSDVPPADGPYIRGRVEMVNGQRANVHYGIEAFFMQQGDAQKLEDARRKERPGAPIDAEVAISGYGLAVLKGYHWEPLGIVATFERANFPPPPVSAPTPVGNDQSRARPQPPPPPRPRQGQFISAVKLELKNYGTEDVAIVDLPDGGSFRLAPDNRGQEMRYRWTGESQAPAHPKAEQIIVLKPGQSHVTTIDLSRPRWAVVDTKAKPDKQQPMMLRDVTDPWSASFRVEYAPPAKADIAGLPNGQLVRFGRLRSRAFTPAQGGD